MPQLEEVEGLLFTLKDITYIPDTPRMNEPFLVRGKVELFGIPFLAPVWVIVTAEYPETWWEEIIPIIGAPQVREMAMVLGADFEITFKGGFTREGVFKLTTRFYAGPTMPIDKLTLPPFPPVATSETTFIVSGKAPPPEEVWEIVEDVSNIVIEAGPEIGAWEMVEEVDGIVIGVGPEIAIWEMVEEIPDIVVEVGPEIAIWEMLEEIPGIVVEVGPEIAIWEMLEEIPGIVVRAVAPPPAEYTLEVTIEPPGAGLVIYSPKAPYSPGEVVTLVATPNPGYEFDHWGGWPPYPGVGSTSSTMQIAMTADWWVVAIFREVAPPPVEYTLGVTIEPPATGYVTKSPSKAKYSAGEVVTLTAHPYSGYVFDHWGGWPPYPGVGSTSSTMQIAMTADWWVVAVFRKVTEPPPEPPPEPEPEPEPTVYYCPYCGSPFASEVLRNQHMDFCPAKPTF